MFLQQFIKPPHAHLGYGFDSLSAIEMITFGNDTIIDGNDVDVIVQQRMRWGIYRWMINAALLCAQSNVMGKIIASASPLYNMRAHKIS